MRVITSTVQGSDVEETAEDPLCTAISAGRTVRETYSKNPWNQKEYRIALTAYDTPDGAHRWAVTYDNPSETDWADTGDLDEALAEYERQVREEAALLEPTYDDKGEIARPAGFDYTDVEGVPATKQAEADLVYARGIAATWATEHLQQVQADAQRAVEAAAVPRAVAVTRLVDTFGRGGQSFAAGHLGVSQPTVADLVRRGRAAEYLTELQETVTTVLDRTDDEDGQ